MSTGFEIALLTTGVVLFLLGLVGRVKTKDIEVGTANKLARVVGGVLGIVFICLSFAPHGIIADFLTREHQESKETWQGTWHYVSIDRSGKIINGSLQLVLCPNDLVSGIFENEGPGSGTILGQLESNSRAVNGQWTNSESGQVGKFSFHLKARGDGYCGTYSLGLTEPDANPLNFWNGKKQSEKVSIDSTCYFTGKKR